MNEEYNKLMLYRPKEDVVKDYLILEHNWNELKSWLEGNIKLLDDVYLGENKNNYSEDMILDMSSRKWGYKNTLDKMKWLEGMNDE